VGGGEIVVTGIGSRADEAAEDVDLATGRSGCRLGIAGPEECRGTVATVGSGCVLASGANGLSVTGSASSGIGGGRIKGTRAAGGINREAECSCSESGTDVLAAVTQLVTGRSQQATTAAGRLGQW
jgi:hypothetical protein